MFNVSQVLAKLLVCLTFTLSNLVTQNGSEQDTLNSGKTSLAGYFLLPTISPFISYTYASMTFTSKQRIV